MAVLDHDKVDPDLKEWFLAHPDERVFVTVLLRMDEKPPSVPGLLQSEIDSIDLHNQESALRGRMRKGLPVDPEELRRIEQRHREALAQAARERKQAKDEYRRRHAEVHQRLHDAVVPLLREIEGLDIYEWDLRQPRQSIAMTVALAHLPHLVRIERVVRISTVAVLRTSLDVSHRAIRADTAHADGIDGDSVWVAILDTGIHRAFGAQEQENLHPDVPVPPAGFRANFATAETTFYDLSPSSHGTGVASVVANDHSTYTAVASKADLMNAKVAEADGGSSVVAVINGATWCMDPSREATVLNTSLNAAGPATGQHATERFMDYLTTFHKTPVWVQAAGNTGDAAGASDKAVRAPGGSYNAITVGAYNDQGQGNWEDRGNHTIHAKSSVGPVDPAGSRKKPDLSAPGYDIWVAHTTGSQPTDHTWHRVEGTSFATPHVSGAAALLRSVPFPAQTGGEFDDAMFV